METPPVTNSTKKILFGSLNKSSSLTPCRRPGLSRPSSNSLHKSCQTNHVCTTKTDARVMKKSSVSSVDSTPKLTCNESPIVPSKLSDTQNGHSVIRKVRRRLTVPSKTPVKVDGETKNVYVKDNSRTCKKIKLNLDQTNDGQELGELSSVDNHSSSLACTTDDSIVCTETNDNSDEVVTLEAIEKLLKSIQEKKKKLEQLNVQETYAKKHNLEELRAQTAKWKKAGQEALEYSVSLAKNAGYTVTIKELMSQHSFPRHLMGYDSEDDEFE